jgi:hypothetical protein
MDAGSTCSIAAATPRPSIVSPASATVTVIGSHDDVRRAFEVGDVRREARHLRIVRFVDPDSGSLLEPGDVVQEVHRVEVELLLER